MVEAGLSVVKIGVLLERRGVVVPYRTLHRFCVERCGFGQDRRDGPGRRRGARGWSASWTSATWACWPTR